LKDRIWGRGANYNHNDAVVAVGSALFTNPSVEQALDTQLLGSPVTHFESGFTCGATYYTSSALAQKTASMLLRGMDGGESMQRAMAAPVRVEDSETSQDDSLRAMPAIVDTVPSGQVAEQSFVIPHTTAAHIMLVSTDATLTLETPTGGMITPADTATVDGLTYYGEPGSGFAGFHIDHPAAGTWVAHVDGTAAASTQTYAVMVEYASPYVAEMSTPSLSLHPGDTLRVRAAISLEGTPVPSVAWTCYLVRPDDSVISLPVFDDGAHDDGSADDGTYGAVVVTGAGFGDYQAFGRVTLGTGEAFATGTAATVAQFADLSVDSLDIYLSKNLVVADDSVSVFVTVHNHGPSAAMGVLVTVTDERTFDELGTATLDIAANGSATAQLPWRLAEPDTHRLHVSVSPYGPPSEASLANNAANRTVILGYPVGVGEEAPLKGQLSFRAPRPNPSHGTVTLTFGLPTSAEATLEVFDVLGRRVRRWEWPLLAAGTHSVDWNGTTDSGHTLPVGVFLCRLRVGTETRSQKVILR
jgi:hypothetical protein